MYPYAQTSKEYMSGHPTVFKSADLPCSDENFDAVECSKCFGFIKAEVLPPTDMYLPVLWHRTNGKIYYTLCRACTDYGNHTKDCNHDDNQHALTSTWPSFELQLALENGYQIRKVHGVWDWRLRSTKLFTNYVNTFLKNKVEASGVPEKFADNVEDFVHIYEEKQGLVLEPARIVKNSGRRTVAKLCLNSLW